jgi:hypothetical protein
LSYPSLFISIDFDIGLFGNIKRSKSIRIMKAPTMLNTLITL